MKKKQGVGHQLPPGKKEQIIADLKVYESFNFIAKKNDVSWDTVSRIHDEYEKLNPDDPLKKYREQKKMEFADNAWESIQKAMKIGDRKLTVALDRSEEIDLILNKLVQELANKDATVQDIKDIVKQISALNNYTLRDLSTYIGTLFDKHELVNGDPTDRLDVNASEGIMAAYKKRRKKGNDEDGNDS